MRLAVARTAGASTVVDRRRARVPSPVALRGARDAPRRRARVRASDACETPHGRRGDADLHARRHERHGQGARPGRPARRSAPRIILANTYHLVPAARARAHPRASAASIASWPGTGPSSPTSGGFQVVSLGDLRDIDDDGVTFRSHLDGTLLHFTPEHAIAVQEALGADIAVCLDQPVPPHASSRGEVARGHGAHASLGGALPRGAPAPGPGALRHHPGRPRGGPAARVVDGHRGLPFDGLCIGGLAGDETPQQRRAVLDVVVPLLADDPRPRYLMGLGSPLDLLDAVDAGVDMFDSVLPARVARNGSLWVPGGRLNLRNARFLDDPRPVQEDCRCRLCRSFSRAYLAHLFRADELLAYRLATCHNLTFTLDFMASIRSAIRAGTFPELDAVASCQPKLARRALRLPMKGGCKSE